MRRATPFESRLRAFLKRQNPTCPSSKSGPTVPMSGPTLCLSCLRKLSIHLNPELDLAAPDHRAFHVAEVFIATLSVHITIYSATSLIAGMTANEVVTAGASAA